ncbi:phage protease [Aeromonas caviae]|uniref:phage protease n=1 Tax=Aeromonas caviae TaxID=648 RepID=UPI003EC7F44F
MKEACCSVEFEGRGQNGVPHWIRIWPRGPLHDTRDGRQFRLDNPLAYVAKLNASNVDIVVDYEHSTASGNGQKAPAAGWLKEFKENEGEVWGRVEWTDEATDLLSKKKYRYISPHFNYGEGLEVLNLWSVALVNSPALNMEAICAANKQLDTATAPMAEVGAVLKSAGVATLSGLYAKLEHDKNIAILSAVESAREKMIIPASIQDELVEVCKAIGIEKFQRIIKILSSIQGLTLPSKSQVDGLEKPTDKKSLLTPQEQEICKNSGITEEQFIEEKRRLANR